MKIPREILDIMVRDYPEIDVIIVHKANGDNEFFSHKPEVEACERARVIQACVAVIAGIREVEAKEARRARRRNEPMSCPGGGSPAGPAKCPSR